jgi:hypothetical protein
MGAGFMAATPNIYKKDQHDEFDIYSVIPTDVGAVIQVAPE